MNRPQEAIERFKQALRMRPDDARTYTELGILYLKTGRAQEAVDALAQAIRLDPAHPPVVLVVVVPVAVVVLVDLAEASARLRPVVVPRLKISNLPRSPRMYRATLRCPRARSSWSVVPPQRTSVPS
jgi:tetratricopeptide (TPR) repeat protein